ncbi:MAG: integral membrane protein-like protein [uncultured bacterium]|nr:MAG: integral membrane protein-like protein [uncultured bacterium]KAF0173069.1 MAG: Integral membrane protein-like protein [Paracoccaceae bacterium]
MRKAPQQSGAFCFSNYRSALPPFLVKPARYDFRMPYEWLPSDGDTQRLHLWPYRSLPRRGMVWFIGSTAALIALPLLVLLGSPVLWGLLPFLLLTLWGIWTALSRSFKDGETLEDLRLDRDEISLTRHDRKGEHRWQANPHWVRVTLHKTKGPVPDYLTLTGNGREVELGAFLSPEERLALDIELRRRLSATRRA